MAASAVPALTSNGFTPATTRVLEWPEPVQRVQELAESGIKSLPPRYIKPEEERKPTYETRMGRVQVVNHGIPSERLKSVMRVSRGFFDLPMAEKLKYANNPVTYEGYGSRLGVQKGIPLDWNDYYFHLLRPISATNGQQKWPRQPTEYRRVISEYGEMVMGLCKRLLSIFSRDLKLEEEGSLLERLGGESGLEASYRMNYYPKCPQPELALGLSPHTDPGAMTVLLQDVSGLQVQRDGLWFLVPPVEGALVVILGDQLEIVSNGIYNSVNHRTTVNREKERMSMVVFVNPLADKKIGPLETLVKRSSGFPLYQEMSFNEYRKFIRTLGIQEKAILASIVNANPQNI